MHRPDTMSEIHRERVQNQTLDVFSGDVHESWTAAAATSYASV
jgi:hypothetical protein